MPFGDFDPNDLYSLLNAPEDDRGRLKGKRHALRTARLVAKTSERFKQEYGGFKRKCCALVDFLESACLKEQVLELPASGANPLRGQLGKTLYPSMLLREEDSDLHIFTTIGLAGRWYLQAYPDTGEHLAAFSFNKSFQVAKLARPSLGDRVKLRDLASRILTALEGDEDPGQAWVTRLARSAGFSDDDLKRLDPGLRAAQNGLDALVGWSGGNRMYISSPTQDAKFILDPVREELVEDAFPPDVFARVDHDGIWQPTESSPGEIIVPRESLPETSLVQGDRLDDRVPGISPPVMLAGEAVPSEKTDIRKALDREQAFKQATLSLAADFLPGSARVLATAEFVECLDWLSRTLKLVKESSLRAEALHCLRMVGELSKPVELVARSTCGPGSGLGFIPHLTQHGKVFIAGPSIGRSRRSKDDDPASDKPLRDLRFSVYASRDTRRILPTQAWPSASVRVFKYPVEDLIAEVLTLEKELRSVLPTFTLSRFQAWLPGYLFTTNGNFGMAQLLAGSTLGYSDAHLHYLMLPARLVHDVYRQAVDHFFKLYERDPRDSVEEPGVGYSRIGEIPDHEFTVKVGAVVAAAEAMASRRPPKDVEEHFEYWCEQLAMSSRYTFLLFVAGCGPRPTEVLSTLVRDHFDPDIGLATLCEKPVPGADVGRPLALPSDLCKQIRIHLRLVHKVCEWCRQDKRGERASLGKFLQGVLDGDRPLFFDPTVADPAANIESLPPLQVSQIVDALNPEGAPWNAVRHRFISHLYASPTSAKDPLPICIQAGHLFGLTLIGPNAGVPLVELPTRLIKGLDDCVTRDGWRVVAFPGSSDPDPEWTPDWAVAQRHESRVKAMRKPVQEERRRFHSFLRENREQLTRMVEMEVAAITGTTSNRALTVEQVDSIHSSVSRKSAGHAHAIEAISLVLRAKLMKLRDQKWSTPLPARVYVRYQTNLAAQFSVEHLIAFRALRLARERLKRAQLRAFADDDGRALLDCLIAGLFIELGVTRPDDVLEALGRLREGSISRRLPFAAGIELGERRTKSAGESELESSPMVGPESNGSVVLGPDPQASEEELEVTDSDVDDETDADSSDPFDWPGEPVGRRRMVFLTGATLIAAGRLLKSDRKTKLPTLDTLLGGSDSSPISVGHLNEGLARVLLGGDGKSGGFAGRIAGLVDLGLQVEMVGTPGPFARSGQRATAMPRSRFHALVDELVPVRPRGEKMLQPAAEPEVPPAGISVHRGHEHYVSMRDLVSTLQKVRTGGGEPSHRQHRGRRLIEEIDSLDDGSTSLVSLTARYLCCLLRGRTTSGKGVEYRRRKLAASSTYRYITSFGSAFFSRMADREFGDLQPGELDQIVLGVLADKTDSEKLYAYSQISAFLRFVGAQCVSVDFMPDVIEDLLPDLQEVGADAGLVVESEFKRLIDDLGDRISRARDDEERYRLRVLRIAAVLMYQAGLRVGEVRRIRFKDMYVARDVGFLRIVSNQFGATKGRRPRRLPLSWLIEACWMEELTKLIQEAEIRAGVAGHRPENPLLSVYGHSEQALPIYALPKDLSELLKKVTGDPSARPHWLRHSFAQRMIEHAWGDPIGDLCVDTGERRPAPATSPGADTSLRSDKTSAIGKRLERMERYQIVELISEFMGHREFETTLQNYYHLGQARVAVAAMRSLMGWRPCEKALAIGNTKAAFKKWRSDFQKRRGVPVSDRVLAAYMGWVVGWRFGRGGAVSYPFSRRADELNSRRSKDTLARKPRARRRRRVPDASPTLVLKTIRRLYEARTIESVMASYKLSQSEVEVLVQSLFRVQAESADWWVPHQTLIRLLPLDFAEKSGISLKLENLDKAPKTQFEAIAEALKLVPDIADQIDSRILREVACERSFPDTARASKVEAVVHLTGLCPREFAFKNARVIDSRHFRLITAVHWISHKLSSMRRQRSGHMPDSNTDI